MNENVDYEQLALDAENKQGGGDPSWTGIVDGYAIKEVTMHENGSAIIVFHQPSDEKGYTTKLFLNPVDTENIQVYEGDTKESAIVKAITKENRLFKQLARNYKTQEEVDAAFTGAKGFVAKVEALKSCLPENVAEITGRIVIGYNAKGYLTIPNKLAWSSDDKQFLPFFSTDVNQKMQNLPSNLTRSKVVPSTEVDANNVAEVSF